MTFEQLRIFVSVAACLHVTRAAKELGLTQSAVSASISALEARHGTRLFDRVGRRIELSEVGRIFLPEAKAILARVEGAHLLLDDLSGETRGRLRLHASQTVASYWLPERMLAMHEHHPSVTLELTVGNTAQVAAAVLEGGADLGFVEGEVTQQDLLRQVVARDGLVMVAAPDHPVIAYSHVPPEAYVEFDWILREHGSGTRSEFETHLRKSGISPESLSVVLELPSNEAVLNAVSSGRVVSVLSERAAGGAAAAGRVSMIRIDCHDRPFAVLSHPQRYRTRAVTAMLELIDKTRGNF